MYQDFPFIQSKKTNFKEVILTIFILIFATCFVRFHALSSLNSKIIGGTQGDAGLYVWLFNFSLKDIWQFGWFNTSYFFPYSKALAWSDNFLLPALIGKIFTTLGLSKILAYNLILLFSTFLNGFFTFLLAQKLSGRVWLALTSALLFLCYNFFTLNLGHPQLQFAFFIPLALLFFINFISKKNIVFSLALGLTVSGAFLTTVYYAVFIPLLIFAFSFFFILLHPHHFNKNDYQKFFLGVLFGLLPLIPFVLPYLATKDTFGNRYLSEPYAFTLGTLNYISYTKNLFLSGCSKCQHLHFENVAFGLVPLVLILAYLFRFAFFPKKKLLFTTVSFIFLTILLACFIPFTKNNLAVFFNYEQLIRFSLATTSWISLILLSIFIYHFGILERKHQVHYLSNRGLVLLLFATAYFFFILTLGPLGDITVNKDQATLGVFSAFFYIFPGLKSIRDISRLAIVVTLCLSLILPFSIMAFTKYKSFLRQTVTITLICFLIFENFQLIFPLEPVVQIPDTFKTLAARASKEDITFVLPMTSNLNKAGNIKSWQDYAIKNVNYMNIASELNLHIVNGYSGMVTKLMRDYPRKMAHFPDERSLKALSTITGLRFVLFNSKEEPNYNAELFQAKLNKFKTNLTKITEDNLGWQLFEIKQNNLISKDFFLQVPSYPKGTLHIKLKSAHKKENSNLEINLFAKQRITDKPFYTLNLPEDEAWHNFNIPIPQTVDSVRPLFLLFKFNSDNNIYLGENYFTILPKSNS